MNRFLKNIAFSIIMISFITNINLHSMCVKNLKNIQRMLRVRQLSEKPCDKLKLISYISEEEQKKIDEAWKPGCHPKPVPYASDELDPETRLSKEEVLKFFKRVTDYMPKE